MEERNHDSSSNVYTNHHVRPNSDDQEDLDDVNEGSTFVIQVPKDQIYRVPPPENALIAERYRTTPPEKHTCFSKKCFLLFLLIVFLLIIFIVGINLAAAKKSDPTFRVRRIQVKSTKKHHEFDISLGSKNQNDRSIISFDHGGKAFLSYHEKEFAKGKFPTLKQDTNSVKDIKLNLTSGSVKKMPKEIQKSINGTSSRPIKLSLGFKAPLHFKVGAFQVKSKTISILCNFKVNKLRKNSRVLSQECDYYIS